MAFASALLCLALAPAAAQALTPSEPDPAAFQTNGNVNAIARGGGLTFIGGDFTQLSARTGPGVRFGQASGRRVAPVAEVRGGGGQVLATAPDGDGGYFIGGEFTHVGGEERSNIAHILPDGSVDPAFDPDADDTVRALAVSGSDVYVGGNFQNIGGAPRSAIAKLYAPTGNAFSSWNAGANNAVGALAVSGSAVYAGGVFTSIAGEPRNHIAKLSATSGNVFSGFKPDANGNVNALAVSGSDLYVGGAFSGADSIGGQDRDFIAKLSAPTGNAFSSWDPDAEDDVHALALEGDDLYVGGQFQGADSIGGQDRDFIAKLSAPSGNAFSTWDPDADNQVHALAASGSAVYAGGDFTDIGGLPRNRIAKLSAASGNSFSGFDPNVNSTIVALATGGNHVYAGGFFDTVNPVARENIAALDSTGAPTAFDAGDLVPSAFGDDVKALAVEGSNVYAGGTFTHIGGRDRDFIAKLSAASGNAFSTFNAQSDQLVQALAVEDNAVYVSAAGGAHIGGQPRNRISKLSGTTGNAFSAFASPPAAQGGADDDTSVLAVEGNSLYAGGFFTTLGGEPRQHIAKLSATSGNAFSSFNPMANDFVFGLAVDGNDVYVGGLFNSPDDITPSIGGQPRDHIAKLSGASGNVFSGFDPKANGDVQALAVAGDNVYAGGVFTEIGGEPRNRLAKLSGTSGNAFSAFNPNADAPVAALAANGNVVYAGGSFANIGGRPRQGFAQFTAP